MKTFKQYCDSLFFDISGRVDFSDAEKICNVLKTPHEIDEWLKLDPVVLNAVVPNLFTFNTPDFDSAVNIAKQYAEYMKRYSRESDLKTEDKTQLLIKLMSLLKSKKIKNDPYQQQEFIKILKEMFNRGFVDVEHSRESFDHEFEAIMDGETKQYICQIDLFNGGFTIVGATMAENIYIPADIPELEGLRNRIVKRLNHKLLSLTKLINRNNQGGRE